jgi:hypothetical protein
MQMPERIAAEFENETSTLASLLYLDIIFVMARRKRGSRPRAGDALSCPLFVQVLHFSSNIIAGSSKQATPPRLAVSISIFESAIFFDPSIRSPCFMISMTAAVPSLLDLHSIYLSNFTGTPKPPSPARLV